MASKKDDSGEGSSEQSEQPSQKKRRYLQKYVKSWESESEFHGWLKESSKGLLFAYCSACNVHLALGAGKLDLKKHAAGKKHIQNCSMLAKQPSVFSMPSVSGKKRLDDAVKESEIRLATFICEHDLPIRVIEHMPDLIKSLCPDSHIAKHMKCGRTKLTSIVKNVTGLYSFDLLVEQLQNSKFSLIVDESTDKGCIKHLCMVARTLVNDEVKDCFLGLIPVQDATAVSLYNLIVKFFNDHKIPYKDNMIGFAADGANVMLGAHNSLSVLLKNDIPGLFIMKCICHSFALCASYACLKLPREVEDLARDVYSYFHCSPKRMGALEEFQLFVKVKPHKLLHPSQTRWLSLHMVVSRLLEQYDALKLYFTGAVLDERLVACESILNKLSNPLTRLYLQFLDYILPIFNNLNKQMQSESSQIHKLHNSISHCYRTILNCYLREDCLKNRPLGSIAFADPHNFKKLESMYLGAKVGIALSKDHGIAPQGIHVFRQRCLSFYIEAASQICKRFSFNNPVFQKLEVLDPAVVKSKAVTSLAALMAALPSPSFVTDNMVQDIDNEWMSLLSSDLGTTSTDETAVKFWVKVRDAKSGDGESFFPLLSKVMLNLLCLPHSSATVERVFSAVNRMKTKLRNRLSTETINGLLHTKRFLTNNKCNDVPICKALVDKMNSDMYKKGIVVDADDSDED